MNLRSRSQTSSFFPDGARLMSMISGAAIADVWSKSCSDWRQNFLRIPPEPP